MNSVVISNMLGVLQIVLLTISLQMRKKSRIMLFQVLAGVVLGVICLVQWRTASALMVSISIVQGFVFYLYFKHNKRIPLYMLIAFGALTIVAVAYTYQNPVDLLLLGALLVLALAQWHGDIWTTRYLFMLASVFFATFHFSIMNYTSMANEIFLIFNGFVAIMRFKGK